VWGCFYSPDMVNNSQFLLGNRKELAMGALLNMKALWQWTNVTGKIGIVLICVSLLVALGGAIYISKVIHWDIPNRLESLRKLTEAEMEELRAMRKERAEIAEAYNTLCATWYTDYCR
jgi:hypothetical protein